MKVLERPHRVSITKSITEMLLNIIKCEGVLNIVHLQFMQFHHSKPYLFTKGEERWPMVVNIHKNLLFTWKHVFFKCLKNYAI